MVDNSWSTTQSHHLPFLRLPETAVALENQIRGSGVPRLFLERPQYIYKQEP